MFQTSHSVRSALFASAATFALSGGAFAQSAAPAPKHHHHHDAATTGSDRLDLLEKRVEEQAKEIHELKVQLNGGTAKAPAQQVSAAQFEALQNQVYEQAAATKSQATVAFRKGRPTISSPDGKWTFSPRVLVQSDFSDYGKALVAGIALKKSGENFRRAQIGFQGTFAGDFGYKFIYDFGGTNGDETYQAAYCNTGTPPKLCTTGAGTGPHIKEAWVSYTGFLAPFTFQVGALPTPSNLGDATASDDLVFIERASPSQLSRSLGGDDGRDSVGFSGNGSFWYASLFLTGDTYGKGALIAPADSQESIVGRIAFVPWQDTSENLTLHIGANGTDTLHPQQATSAAGTTATAITFSDRPELRTDNVTFLNTGAIDAKSAYSAGVEAAFSYGPVFVEGENFWYGIDRSGAAVGVTNPNFSGWYVEGGWVVTGEGRHYNMQTASFQRPSPEASFNPSEGNWGAWEIAGRYSSTNLDYHIGSANTADRVFGGEQNVWSAGINFYPVDAVKFALDWQSVSLRNIGKFGNNDSYNTISLRSQVSF